MLDIDLTAFKTSVSFRLLIFFPSFFVFILLYNTHIHIELEHLTVIIINYCHYNGVIYVFVITGCKALGTH